MQNTDIFESNEFLKSLDTKLHNLDSITSQIISEQFEKWQTEYLKVRKCVTICSECRQSLLSLFEHDFKPVEYWQTLDKYVHQLLDWTDTWPASEGNDYSIPDQAEFQNMYLNELSTSPESIKLYLTDAWWKPQKEDSLNVRFWKQFNQIRMFGKKTSFSTINKFRKLVKKEPLQDINEFRTVNVQQFIQYYYISGVYPLLVRSKHEFQQHVIENQAKLHHQVNILIDTIFAVENFKNIFTQEHLLLLNNVQSTIQILQDIEAIINDQIAVIEKIHSDFNSRHQSLRMIFYKNWNYAGTAILLEKQFNDEKYSEVWVKSKSKLEVDTKSWQSGIEIEKQDWKKDLELLQLQIHSFIICIETIKTLDHKIIEQILPTFTEPQSLLKEALNKFIDMEQNPTAELKKEILTENRMTIRSLRREKIPKIIDTILQSQLLKSLENYLSRIRYNAEKLPEKQIIQQVSEKSREKRIAGIPLKALMMEEIIPDFAKSHSAMLQDVQQKMDKITRDISEVDQIVEFNFIAALDVLEQEQVNNSEPARVVIEGLTRANNQFINLSDHCKEINDIAKKWLLQSTLDFQEQVHKLENNEKINELQIRIAKAHTREKIRQYKHQAVSGLKKFFPTLLLFLKGTLEKFSSNIQNIKKITGLGAIQPDSEQQTTRFLFNSQKQLEKMPYVYQQLFRPVPLEDERFFSGRQPELEKIKELFNIWKEDPCSATALVGENGSGRTTLLYFSETQVFRGFPVYRMEISKTHTTQKDLFDCLSDTMKHLNAENLDTLEEKLSLQENRTVCIVENAHKMFLRTVDGFDALERLMLLISRTQHKVFWIISFGIYSWKYLEKAIGLSRYMTNVITLSEMSISFMESIILKRHRVSGYQLEFEGEPALLASRKYKKLPNRESQQEFLKNIYFEQLNRQALGNISVAFLLWLLSIREIKEDKLIITPVINFDISFLPQISQDILFTFAAFLQHQTLNENEYAEIHHISLQQSTMLLENLKSKGLLIKGPKGYQIHTLIYRPVVRILKMNNILQD